jgi:hypothetical protein
MSTLPQFDDLRTALSFIESSPLLSDSYPYVSFDKISFFAQSPEAFAEMVRELRGSIDAPLVKSESAGYREVSKVFGRYRIEINLNLAAHCEQVQIGTQTVEREVVLTPAVTSTELVEVPILEWQCKPVLAVAVDEVELPPTAVGWTDDPF